MEKKILRERRRRFAAFLMVLVMVIPALGVAETGTSYATGDNNQEITWNFSYVDNPTAWVTIYKTGATVQNIQITLKNSTATCTTDGTAECYLSGTYFKDSEDTTGESVACTIPVVNVPAAGHQLERVAQRDASCTEKGCSIECFQCKICKQYFANEDGVIPAYPVFTEATGHNWKATWNWATDYSSATTEFVCQNNNTHKETPTVTVGKTETKPDCTTNKFITYTAEATATDGTKLTNTPPSIEVPNTKTGHDWKATWNWASDYSSATTEFVCQNNTGHTETPTVTVGKTETEPDCTTNQFITYTAEATATDGTKLTNTPPSIEVPNTKTGHDWKATWNWASDYSSATTEFVCQNNTGHTETPAVTVDKAETEPDCTTNKFVTYTAEATASDGKTLKDIKANIEIPNTAKGHKWTATWNWATDYSSATTEFVCENDKNHKETPTVTVTSQETTAAGCESNQIVTYTAKATAKDGTELTDSKTGIEVPKTATGHKWAATWNWATDHSSATTEFVCENDKNHKETPTATVSSQVVTEAGCTTNEFVTYTAKATAKDGTELTDTTASIEVPDTATGHRWEATWDWASDYSSATTQFVCQNNKDHKESPTVTVTSQETTAAGCENNQVVTYTAKATAKDGTELTDTKKDIEVPNTKTGHKWEVAKWNWAADYSTATVDLVCKNDKTHEVKDVEAKVSAEETTPATCEGNKAFTYTANAGYDGAVFTDKKENIPIADTATGHDWKAVKWTWAEDYSTATVELVCQNNEDHKKTITVNSVPKTVKAETCETNRIVTYTATAEFDEKTFTDTKENIEVAGTATGKHQLTAFEKKDPTCTEKGNKAYWYCPECGKYFSDAEGTQEIETDSWILPVIDEHAWTFTEVTWAESTEGGYAATANFKCANSETHTTQAKMTVSSETTAASCKDEGKTVYTAILAADDSPDKKEHKDEKTVTIAKKAHTPDAAVREKETAATCEAGGSYDEVVYCSVCKAQLSRKAVTTEMLGHEWGEWTTTREATEEQEGVKVRACSRCTATEEASIPRLEPTPGGEGDGTGGDKTGGEGGTGDEGGTGGDNTGTQGEGTGDGSTLPEEVLNRIRVVVVAGGGISYVRDVTCTGKAIKVSKTGVDTGALKNKLEAVAQATLMKNAIKGEKAAFKGSNVKKVTVKTKAGKRLNVTKLKKAGLSKAKIKKLKKAFASIGKTKKERNILYKKLIQGGIAQKSVKFKKLTVSK